MSRITCWLLLAALLIGWQAATALAIPAFKSEFEEYYKVTAPTTDCEKALAEKVAEAKCNVCHVDGEKKEVRNTYGAALDQLLDKANFSADRRKAEPDKVKQEIQEALQKVETEKASDAETYGDRLKAGNLPCP
jgi:hypothetical protein